MGTTGCVVAAGSWRSARIRWAAAEAKRGLPAQPFKVEAMTDRWRRKHGLLTLAQQTF